MKKGSVLLIALLLMLGLCVAAAAEDTEPTVYECGEFKYSLLPDGTAEIVGHDDRKYDDFFELVVPDSVDGYPVTSIGNRAFSDSYELRIITIPNGVTSIGDYAFYDCRVLRYVILPEGLISIGDYAFSYCESLNDLVLPEGLVNIGDFAFIFTYMRIMELPDSVTEIGINPFCSMEGVYISPDHPIYASIDGMLIDKTERKLIFYPDVSSKTVCQVPDGICIIGDYALCCCYSVTDVVFPESVIHIGDKAFSECRSLSSITMADGLISIGVQAFSDCFSLTNIVLPEGLTSIGDGAFSGCSKDMLFMVVRDSWAENWCRENGKNYTCTDSLDWLNE